MAPRPQTSAEGVLALLSEPEPLLRQHALRSLNTLIPQFWAEISEYITTIEALYESDDLPKDARDLAALVASKVYYYLAEYDEALSFALGAGLSFESERGNPGSEEYVETVISKAIDRYIALRREEDEAGLTEGTKIDPRLKDIIEGIFKRCIDDGEYKQALGIALESARLDLVTHVFRLTQDTNLLSYVMDAVLDTGFKLSFRNKVLYHILPLFPPPTPQSAHLQSLTHLHITLSSSEITVALLTSLLNDAKKGDANKALLAYQIAFDIAEGGAQDYIEAVRSALPQATVDEADPANRLQQILSGEETINLYLDFLKRNNHVDLLILKNTKDSLDPRSSVYHTALTLSNAFMHAGTSSDVFLRENLDWLGRASNWSKFSATAGLGVIHKGNFKDGLTLLSPYLPTPANASAQGSSSYSEGGSLYALGLINAGRGKDVLPFLRDKLQSIYAEVVQHGAALGLGIAGIASNDQASYDELLMTLLRDSAVAGEACGLAMGLVKLGTGEQSCLETMLEYAHETQHEKIIRGLAIGVAFICYGRQEEADKIIEDLLAEKDPILRYGGVYTLALAYAGTADNRAVKKLLHVAVSDTSDDVRRAAVTSLAFLLFKNPGQVPRIVQLLSESYNPHVRCGATLALGISCAGTGLQEAIDLLEPMTKDPVDFVRQGAFIALAMILVQQTEVSSPSVASSRVLFAKIISDKREDPMARFGASIAQGLIDAGGRNVTINLQSRAGSKNMNAIVGMTLFCQFWYWYPLALCASLAFEPTGIIGLSAELKPPAFEFISNAKPSLFAYPSPTKPPTKETVEKVATAVLSITAKAKAREKKKEEKAAADAMDTDDRAPVKADIKDVEMVDKDAKEDVEMKGTDAERLISTGTEQTPAVPKRERRQAEPTSEKLNNLSRVTPAQMAYITFPTDGRFQPVRAVSSFPPTSSSSKSLSKKSERYAGGGGILMLIDRKPGEPIEYIDRVVDAPEEAAAAEDDQATQSNIVLSNGIPVGIANANPANDADPPPPFEYPFGNDT